MSDPTIVTEKTDQAIETLQELDCDVWLTFARETADIEEPCLPLVLGEQFVWPGMVLITRSGRKIAITEPHDATNIREHGIHEVYGYDESLEEVFLEIVGEIDPDEIGVNYSKANNTADGLSHGLYLRLEEYLEGTPYEGALTSAEPVVKRVRGSKSPTERERLAASAATAEAILDEMQAAWRPEWTEAEVAAFIHDRVDERGLETAWARDFCPSVTAGPEGSFGHTKPGDVTLSRGEVLRFDWGVIKDEYASDMQRLYYWPPEGESEPPADLLDGFGDVRDAIEAGYETLEPGVQGYEVDLAARELLTDRGWPEFEYGFGHQVGRNVHDGGTYLGPRWERYGDAPYGEVREHEVYTLELGVETEYGYLQQEEMAEVTADGARFVTDPQTELRTLSAD